MSRCRMVVRSRFSTTWQEYHSIRNSSQAAASTLGAGQSVGNKARMAPVWMDWGVLNCARGKHYAVGAG